MPVIELEELIPTLQSLFFKCLFQILLFLSWTVAKNRKPYAKKDACNFIVLDEKEHANNFIRNFSIFG